MPRKRFELSTSSLQRKHSPTELQTRVYTVYYILFQYLIQVDSETTSLKNFHSLGSTQDGMHYS